MDANEVIYPKPDSLRRNHTSYGQDRSGSCYIKETDKQLRDLPVKNIQELAILPKKSDISNDAQQILDIESLERFCKTWAEVGRAILLRRKQK